MTAAGVARAQEAVMRTAASSLCAVGMRDAALALAGKIRVESVELAGRGAGSELRIERDDHRHGSVPGEGCPGNTGTGADAARRAARRRRLLIRTGVIKPNEASKNKVKITRGAIYKVDSKRRLRPVAEVKPGAARAVASKAKPKPKPASKPELPEVWMGSWKAFKAREAKVPPNIKAAREAVREETWANERASAERKRAEGKRATATAMRADADKAAKRGKTEGEKWMAESRAAEAEAAAAKAEAEAAKAEAEAAEARVAAVAGAAVLKAAAAATAAKAAKRG